jgi:hypothetical protein
LGVATLLGVVVGAVVVINGDDDADADDNDVVGLTGRTDLRFIRTVGEAPFVVFVVVEYTKGVFLLLLLFFTGDVKEEEVVFLTAP